MCYMSTQDSFQADLLGLLPHWPPVNTQHFTQVSPQGGQVPLVPRVVARTAVGREVWICLVYAVVCQVDELIA